MSEAVRQFLQIVAEHYAEVEAVKMLNQGRAWCPHCHGWTFSHDDGRCSLCHKERAVKGGER